MKWRTVFRLEWRILRRDRGALGAVAVFALFLLLAAGLSGVRSDALTKGLDALQDVDAARFSDLAQSHAALVDKDAALSSKDPRDPVWMGREGASRAVVLEPAPLAPIALGNRELRPQAVRISSSFEQQSAPETESPMVGPTRQRSGAFDPAFIFIVLFPLLIISMSYELLSGERERGTLAMLLSQPVRQTDLAVGKAAARFTLVALATFVLASLGLLAAGVDFTVSGAALHASIYLATLLCWAGVWFAAAVWVNSRQGSSANNALSLVGAWLLVVVIVPGLVNLAVDTALPAPSSMELVHEAREAGLDIEKDLSVLKGRHDQDTTDANYKAKVAASEDLLTERLSPLMAQHREQQEHRAQVLNLLGFLSPAMLVQLSLEDIAGTSAYRQAQFASHVQGLQQAHRRRYVELIKADSPVSSADIKASAQQTAYSMEESTPPSLLLKRALPRLGFLLLLIALITRAAWPGLSRIGRLSN